MSANRFDPHLVVLPEDDADREIAIGFKLAVENNRQFQVLTPSGGWLRVLDEFEKEEIRRLRELPDRHVLILIDFDDDPNRLSKVQRRIPEELIDRVFVLGSLSDPQKLKTRLERSFENIGLALHEDCSSPNPTLWTHPLLVHNAVEVQRIRLKCAGILA